MAGSVIHYQRPRKKFQVSMMRNGTTQDRTALMISRSWQCSRQVRNGHCLPPGSIIQAMRSLTQRENIRSMVKSISIIPIATVIVCLTIIAWILGQHYNSKRENDFLLN